MTPKTPLKTQVLVAQVLVPAASALLPTQGGAYLHSCLCKTVALLVLVLGGLPLMAQETRGAIQGRVSDSSGGSIAGAQVRAANSATGVELTAVTNESGNYVLPYMLPGTYTLEAQAPGFKKSIREGIELRINDRVDVNLELQVGQTSDSIRGERAKRRCSIPRPPHWARLWTSGACSICRLSAAASWSLVQLAPGVINTTDMRLAKSGSFSINKNSQIATDGAGVYNNEFTLDGVSNTQAEGGSTRVGFIPPSAAVAEFKVQTAAYRCQRRTQRRLSHQRQHQERHQPASRTGGVGAAQLRLRRAQHFPEPRGAGNSALYRQPVGPGRRRTRYGYRVFITARTAPSGSMDTARTNSASPSRSPARYRPKPCAAEIFRHCWHSGRNTRSTTRSTTEAIAGGRFQRQPFPGNIIPANRLDPVAQKILTYWPLPNQPGNRDGSNNYFYTPSARENTWDHLGRVDHAFNPNHRIFLRMHSDFWEENKNHTFPDTPAVGIVLNRHNKGAAFDDVYVINSGIPV